MKQTMAKQQAVKDDENKFLQTTRESAEQLLHLFEEDTARIGGARIERRAGGARSMSIQQHRRIEAFEARENPAVGVVHDALRVLVGARAQQHADDDVILRTRRDPRPGAGR